MAEPRVLSVKSVISDVEMRVTSVDLVTMQVKDHVHRLVVADSSVVATLLKGSAVSLTLQTRSHRSIAEHGTVLETTLTQNQSNDTLALAVRAYVEACGGDDDEVTQETFAAMATLAEAVGA